MIVLILLFCSVQVTGQTVVEFFGEDYWLAKKFIIEHKDLIEDSCPDGVEYCNQPDVFISIVFPELVRLSRFKDFFETKALEYAYVSAGRDMANFSIGSFQMRPSFVEDMEAYVVRTGQERGFQRLVNYSSKDEKLRRTERVQRLKQLDWQLYYLQTFLKLAHQIVGDRSFSSAEDYLGFMAAFYNYGLTTEIDKVERWRNVKAFPMGSQFKGKQYSYAEVAIYFYKHDAQSIFQKDTID